MKKEYEQPTAEKLEFVYANMVSASGKNPAQCTGTNPGQGCLDDGTQPGHGCNVENNAPGNCSVDHERKQPFRCVD